MMTALLSCAQSEQRNGASNHPLRGVSLMPIPAELSSEGLVLVS